MASVNNLNKEELNKLYSSLQKEYEDVVSKNYSIDMTRGRPSKEQLDLSDGMLTILKSGNDCVLENGFDARNYGILQGIPEVKRLFASLLKVEPENIFVGGNSSLTFMYDTLVRCLLFGTGENTTPWIKQGKIKFLCPCPGYDRHFAMLEDLGFELIPVPLTGHGPCMDTVEKLVSSDAQIKGMFCVPKYSNPTGECYSSETIKRLANLKPLANDFRIFYDNAYIIHDFENEIEIDNIFDYTKNTPNENLVYEFVSTSKMSHPGSGVCVLASSKENIDYTIKHITFQMISSDKMNQLRLVKFFQNVDNMKSHMKKHGKIMKEKFDVVTSIFDSSFKDYPDISYTNPGGGYFVGLSVRNNTATDVYNLCGKAGIKLTKVGAAFPYNKDPNDNFLRICPSNVSVNDLKTATNVLSLCSKLAYVKTLL